MCRVCDELVTTCFTRVVVCSKGTPMSTTMSELRAHRVVFFFKLVQSKYRKSLISWYIPHFFCFLCVTATAGRIRETTSFDFLTPSPGERAKAAERTVSAMVASRLLASEVKIVNSYMPRKNAGPRVPCQGLRIDMEPQPCQQQPLHVANDGDLLQVPFPSDYW